MMLLAVALSLLIGLSLGLLGGGGSILTVPILVYALGVERKAAIAMSLLVVGVTSASAALQHARMGNVRWRVALLFSAAGMAGAFAGGRLAAFVPANVLLLLFAAVMIATSVGMWRGRKPQSVEPCEESGTCPFPALKAVLLGVTVGSVTGLVGAGGGFLIVPVLALLGRLPMRMAVGSSLAVIALNSFAGFSGYAAHVQVDYALAAVVTGAAVAGSFAGSQLGKRLSAESLRKSFAAFVFVMALYMIGREMPPEVWAMLGRAAWQWYAAAALASAALGYWLKKEPPKRARP